VRLINDLLVGGNRMNGFAMDVAISCNNGFERLKQAIISVVFVTCIGFPHVLCGKKESSRFTRTVKTDSGQLCSFTDRLR